MAGPLVGTPRAYLRCVECGHTRIRHTDHGAGRCAEVSWVPMIHNGEPTSVMVPCTCSAHVPPKRKA